MSIAATRRVARFGSRCRPAGRTLQGTTGARLMDIPIGALGIRQAIASRRLSATEACRAVLDRIAALDPPLNAFRAVAADKAIARAAEIDARKGGGSLPLLGVPIALKDNLCTRGIPTTASSRILEGYKPPYNATVVDRLESAGAVIVGK